MKQILVPVDFSADSINALEHGIMFANKLEANIKIFHVVHYKDFETPLFFRDLVDFEDKTALDFLNLLLYRYRSRVSKNIEHEIIEGNIAKEIISKAKEDKTDYIIMGTQGTTASDSFWMGSNAYKVVENAPCPVITIRSGFVRDNIKKIVLPINFSKHTRRKINAAADIASLFNSEIHVLGVTESNIEDIQKRVESWVNQTLDYLNQRKIKNYSSMVQGSNITDLTIDYAKSIDADLIAIMTEQGEQPFSFILGANAQNAVNTSPIPILSIRPDFTINN